MVQYSAALLCLPRTGRKKRNISRSFLFHAGFQVPNLNRRGKIKCKSIMKTKQLRRMPTCQVQNCTHIFSTNATQLIRLQCAGSTSRSIKFKTHFTIINTGCRRYLNVASTVVERRAQMTVVADIVDNIIWSGCLTNPLFELEDAR